MIYFIQCGCPTGFIKIGYAKNICDRLYNMQVSCPYKLTLLRAIPGALSEERVLHIRFKDLRGVGEWFTAGPELMALIAETADKDCRPAEEPPTTTHGVVKRAELRRLKDARFPSGATKWQ